MLNLRNLEEKKRIENQTKDFKNNNIEFMTRPASRTMYHSNKKKKEETPKETMFKKKVKRVNAEDVHVLGYELRLRMELKKIVKSDIEGILIRKEFVNDNKISMKSLKLILEEYNIMC